MWAAEAKQRHDATALASLKAHVANVMRTKRGKTYQPNDFLPLRWKIKRQQPPQTLEQTGILMVGTLPPWMNRG